MPSSPAYDVVILGAGGAGLMCALQAGQRGRRVLLLEHNEVAGRKILISGGGRCNFTNRQVTSQDFHSSNPHFCKSALARYTPGDFIAMVEAHNIEYYEKKLGQLFCRRSAQQIVDMLLQECRDAEVEFMTDCHIDHVQRSEDGYEVHCGSDVYRATSLVVATGGRSIPKIGATTFGYELAQQFDLNIVSTEPALVGLQLHGEWARALQPLSGIAIETVVDCGGRSHRENTLFTHHGLSGPAILQASLFWIPGKPIHINWLPNVDVLDVLQIIKQSERHTTFDDFLQDYLPRRLAAALCKTLHLDMSVQSITDQALQQAAKNLTHCKIIPNAPLGYDKAEVTRGGVDTAELSSKTMESKKSPGLYFIGEVVDVTGRLGGYNFQWAWSSAFAAAQSV